MILTLTLDFPDAKTYEKAKEEAEILVMNGCDYGLVNATILSIHGEQ